MRKADIRVDLAPIPTSFLRMDHLGLHRSLCTGKLKRVAHWFDLAKSSQQRQLEEPNGVCDRSITRIPDKEIENYIQVLPL